jgi:hypothetical protein
VRWISLSLGFPDIGRAGLIGPCPGPPIGHGPEFARLTLTGRAEFAPTRVLGRIFRLFRRLQLFVVFPVAFRDGLPARLFVGRRPVLGSWAAASHGAGEAKHQEQPQRPNKSRSCIDFLLCVYLWRGFRRECGTS